MRQVTFPGRFSNIEKSLPRQHRRKSEANMVTSLETGRLTFPDNYWITSPLEVNNRHIEVKDAFATVSMENNTSPDSLSDISSKTDKSQSYKELSAGQGRGEGQDVEIENIGQRASDTGQGHDDEDDELDKVGQLPVIKKASKLTKFKCISKVLTFEIRAEHKYRRGDKPTIVRSKVEPIGTGHMSYDTADENFHNLEQFAIKGNQSRYENKASNKTTQITFARSKSQNFTMATKPKQEQGYQSASESQLLGKRNRPTQWLPGTKESHEKGHVESTSKNIDETKIECTSSSSESIEIDLLKNESALSEAPEVIEVDQPAPWWKSDLHNNSVSIDSKNDIDDLRTNAIIDTNKSGLEDTNDLDLESPLTARNGSSKVNIG